MIYLLLSCIYVKDIEEEDLNFSSVWKSSQITMTIVLYPKQYIDSDTELV